MSSADTNQASEADKAIMIGFLYGIQSDLLPEDEVVHRMVAFSHTKGYKEALAIIRTEKLKLLAEVKSSLTQMKELKENRDNKGVLWGSYDVVDLDDIREQLTKLEAGL